MVIMYDTSTGSAQIYYFILVHELNRINERKFKPGFFAVDIRRTLPGVW